jgi:pyruvate formate lyase activating enzyme
LRDTDEIAALIKTSSPFISGVVFSGGEPTMQKDALMALAGYAKTIGLDVGIQTNGFFPGTLDSLIEKKIVDKIAIDYKTQWESYPGTWEGYCNTPKENYQKNVRKSIDICKKAFDEQILKEFEVVVTVFPGNEKDVKDISLEIGKIPLVLQQGEHKIAPVRSWASDMSQGEYICNKRHLQEYHPPLSLEDLKKIADELGRKVRIRTREIGEVTYESNRSRRASRKRQR